MNPFLLGVTTGLDNLIASIGYGPLLLSRRRMFVLAAAFGLCEGGMPLLGAWLAPAVPGSAAMGGALLVLCGLLVLAGATGWRGGLTLVRSPAGLVLVPLALSLDNLAAGAGLAAWGASPVVAAVAVGATSTALAWLGMAVGRTVGRRLGGHGALRAPVLGGAYLTAVGLAVLFSAS